MYKRKPFILLLLLIGTLPPAGCNTPDEEAAQEPRPATAAPANPNTNTGLASPRQDLKDRVTAAAQSNETPVGSAKANTP